MATQRFFGNHIKRDALDPAGGSDKALVDHFIFQSQRFEDLGSLVALQRADAHLGHHFQHAFGDGFAVGGNDFVVVQGRGPSNHRAVLAKALRRPGRD